MRKIIAILTQKGTLSKGIQTNTVVNLFSMENDRINKVENLKLEDTSNNYFSLLMIMKKVSTIYVETINEDLKHLLYMIGIKIKCKEDMNEDKFINHFIFD